MYLFLEMLILCPVTRQILLVFIFLCFSASSTSDFVRDHLVMPSFFLSILLSPSLIHLHQDVLEGSNLRAPLQELHQMIMTPIKAFSGGDEASVQRPLLSAEGKSAAPGSHLSSSSSGGGEAESGTSVIAEGDLPGQFTRVMGKGSLHAPVNC